jgi:hypothetical protein
MGDERQLESPNLGHWYVSAKNFQAFSKAIVINKDASHDKFCIFYEVLWGTGADNPPAEGGYVDMLHPKLYGDLVSLKYNLLAIEKLKQNYTPYETAAHSLSGALNAANYPTLTQ